MTQNIKKRKKILPGILGFSSGLRILKIEVKLHKKNIPSRINIFDIIKVVTNVFYLQLFFIQIKIPTL